MKTITMAHVHLFCWLAESERISIRKNNQEIGKWEELKSAGLCTIFESDRSDTVVIHLTSRGESLAGHFISKLQERFCDR